MIQIHITVIYNVIIEFFSMFECFLIQGFHNYFFFIHLRFYIYIKFVYICNISLQKNVLI